MATLPVRVHNDLFACIDMIQIFLYRNIRHSCGLFDDQLMHQENVRSPPQLFSQTRLDTVLVKVDDLYQTARMHLVFQVIAYGVARQLPPRPIACNPSQLIRPLGCSATMIRREEYLLILHPASIHAIWPRSLHKPDGQLYILWKMSIYPSELVDIRVLHQIDMIKMKF